MTSVALLTDFGTDSWYVGIIRAVITAYNPQAPIIDLGHEVPAGSIKAGAFYLRESSAYLPDGCVICAVVDPGVGSDRPILLGSGQVMDPHSHTIKNLRWVGPDNGIFSWLHVTSRTDYHLSERAGVNSTGLSAQHAGGQQRSGGFVLPKEVSPTFHGRDIFAPLAAQMAAGLELSQFNEGVTPVSFGWPQLTRKKDRTGQEFMEAKIIATDHFGNLLTNLSTDHLVNRGGAAEVRLCRHGALDDVIEKQLSLSATFSDVDSGHWVAYFGSSGLLELAVRDGSARAYLEDLGLDESMLVIRFRETT